MGVEDKIGFEPEPRHFHYPIDSGKPPNFSYCLFFVADVLIGTRDTSRTQLGKHGVMLCARLYYCMVLPANLVGTDPAFQTHTKLICCCRCRCVYNSCLLPLAPAWHWPKRVELQRHLLKLSVVPRRAQEQGPQALLDQGHPSQVINVHANLTRLLPLRRWCRQPRIKSRSVFRQFLRAVRPQSHCAARDRRSFHINWLCFFTSFMSTFAAAPVHWPPSSTSTCAMACLLPFTGLAFCSCSGTMSCNGLTWCRLLPCSSSRSSVRI